MPKEHDLRRAKVANLVGNEKLVPNSGTRARLMNGYWNLAF
jgi:hypothetical protein